MREGRKCEVQRRLRGSGRSALREVIYRNVIEMNTRIMHNAIINPHLPMIFKWKYCNFEIEISITVMRASSKIAH